MRQCLSGRGGRRGARYAVNGGRHGSARLELLLRTWRPRRRRSPGPQAPDEDKPAGELPQSSSASYRSLLSTGGDAAAWVHPRRGVGPQGPLRPCAPPEFLFLPEENVVQRGSGDFFLNQAPQIAQVGDGSPHAEAFASRFCLLPQPPGHLIGSFSIFLLAVDLRVEALLFQLARRPIPAPHPQPQGNPRPGSIPDRLDIPRLGPPVALSEPAGHQWLERGWWTRHQDGQAGKVVIVGEDLHQHL